MTNIVADKHRSLEWEADLTGEGGKATFHFNESYCVVRLERFSDAFDLSHAIQHDSTVVAKKCLASIAGTISHYLEELKR